MMVSGLRTKDQGLEKCCLETDQSMMDNGTLIKFMEEESIFPAMAIGTKDLSTMAWERATDQYSIETAIVTKANGNKISFGDTEFSTLKMAIIMKEVS